MQRTIVAEARTIFRWHLAAIAALLLCHVGLVVAAMVDWGHPLGLRDLFDVSHERNVPAVFSALALLACGGACALNRLWAWRAQDARNWLIASATFAFLAFDEICSVHEAFSRLPLHGTGPLLYAWVVPYAAATAVFAVWLLPFAASLPKRTRMTLLLGFAVFIGSALGMELFEGMIATRLGVAAPDHWAMRLFLTIEEGGEMIGVAILLRSLLLNLPQGGALEVRLGQPAPRAAPVMVVVGAPSALARVPSKAAADRL